MLIMEKLKNKTARIAILGMGYVGLPLAVVFAEAGFNVTGIDPDKRKVDSLVKGVSYIPDISTERLAPLVKSGHLKATTDFSVLKDMDAVSICVPTPLRKTGDPDMSFILSATEQLAKYMHKGMVVVLESTTYPGTTREILLPKLGEANGLKVGEDWFLAFSPERVDPGREDFTTLNTPKVVGGITAACAEVAAGLVRWSHPAHPYGLVCRSRRDGETAGEHLPHDQHRHGQRNGDHVRPDGRGRVGSDRCGRHQALRFHEIHPRSRPGRALHPDRPAVSLLEDESLPVHGPFHRTGLRHQLPTCRATWSPASWRP